jgi:hypothetical protein
MGLEVEKLPSLILAAAYLLLVVRVASTVCPSLPAYPLKNGRWLARPKTIRGSKVVEFVEPLIPFR